MLEGEETSHRIDHVARAYQHSNDGVQFASSVLGQWKAKHYNRWKNYIWHGESKVDEDESVALNAQDVHGPPIEATKRDDH